MSPSVRQAKVEKIETDPQSTHMPITENERERKVFVPHPSKTVKITGSKRSRNGRIVCIVTFVS